MHLNAPVVPHTAFYTAFHPAAAAQEEQVSPEGGRGGSSNADLLKSLSLAQKKNFCSVNRNLSALQMAQQMQCTNGNDVDSDAAKALQAETQLSWAEQVSHTRCHRNNFRNNWWGPKVTPLLFLKNSLGF